MKNLLPGVPLIESPFFDALFPQTGADAETTRIAADLRQKGYAVLDFPDPDFHQLADHIIKVLNDRYDWAEWRREPKGSLRIQDAWQFEPAVRRLAANERIRQILDSVFGRRAFPFQTLNFAVGTQQHVHCDDIHFSCVPEGFMCGVWTALEDIDENNGPLIYYPGSHTWPDFRNEHIGINGQHFGSPTEHYQRYLDLWDAMIEQYKAPPERFFAKKGQTLIWLSHLLHGGDKQNDLQRTRHSLVTHYYFEGCTYYTPIQSDPFYGTIAFRELTDITTGTPTPNSISGHPVPRRFIREAKLGIRDTDDAPADGSLPPDFDPVRYLQLNPDVAQAKADPKQHYLANGFRERRRWR